MSEEYNNEHFLEVGGPEFAAFPNFLRVGEPAPDGLLTRLDDLARIRLSDCWRPAPLVIEFGSIT